MGTIGEQDDTRVQLQLLIQQLSQLLSADSRTSQCEIEDFGCNVINKLRWVA
jgi:hypothetical protein